MLLKLARILLCSFMIVGHAAAITRQDSLPHLLQRDLDSLQKANDLEQWLYLRMDYAVEKPAARLPYLLSTSTQAWRQPKDEYERQAWLDLLTYQGYYQMLAGQIIGSIQSYEAAYKYYFDQPLPHNDIVEFVLKPLGNNYTRLGDYARAEFILRKSLEISEAEKDAQKMAASCCNLAVAALTQEKYDTAKTYGRRGLQYVQRNSGVDGLLHSLMADVYEKTNQLDSAQFYVQRAIQVLKQVPVTKGVDVYYWQTSALEAAGNIALKKKEFQAAAKAYGAALQLLQQHYGATRKREQARLYVKLGNLYVLQQQGVKATALYNRAIEIFIPTAAQQNYLPREQQLYGEYTLADALQGKAKALQLQQQHETALQYLLLTFIVERKLQREFFNRQTKLIHQQASKQLAETAMDEAFALWQATKQTKYANMLLQISEWSKAQALQEEINQAIAYSRANRKDSLLIKQQQLQQAITYHEREIANASGNAAQHQKSRDELNYSLSLLKEQVKAKYPAMYSNEQTFNVDELCKALPANVQAVSYFAGTQHMYALLLNQKGVQHITRIDSASAKLQQMRTFVETYFHNGPSAMMNAPKQYYTQAHEMYRWLLAGLPLQTGKTILLVPDGNIGYLPFDALITSPQFKENPQAWPYFIKQHISTQAYSLQTFVQQQHQPSKAVKNVLGFFISQPKGMPAIPAVKKESEAMQQFVQGDFYNDERATRQLFTERMAGADVLHISTHASLLGDPPVLALHMADDPFYLFELYQHNFHPQLVVLSACKTGDGVLAEGEGIISLSREFAASGARGIIAGLWNVNDAAAAQLTGDMYKYLSTGKPAFAALHQAKLDWLTKETANPSLQLPYYWAMLTYVGHHQPVELIAVRPLVWTRWVAGIVAIGLLLWVWMRKCIFRKK
ncbi:CHAT domain-containing protein [Chitinophaga skermanii]|uniref:CHAT domain-containing protein n=1 Tax=Chitinophaga skermanii TaxID=331697 RepID=A0A327R2R3_9BACT|nr:CHAT domain-containing protein [Chitinophaga skermanii]RAJ10980.1 CHAT domain-containing protein [Chitinophaga skermanii]